MAKSTIVASNKKYTVAEGSGGSSGTYATSKFTFAALDNQADVNVRLTGIGATKNKDYGDLEYSNDGGINWTKVPKFAGTITLNKGQTELQLRSQILDDIIAGEKNESLVFSVAQSNSAATAKVLQNSYYVTSTATIKESLSLAKISVDTKWYNDRVQNTTFNNSNIDYKVDTASEKFTFQESPADAAIVPATNGSTATATDTYKYAVGAFKLSTKLDKIAVISVKVEGQGADLAEDTVGDLKAFNTTSGTPVELTITNGRVTLPDGIEKFELRVALKGDNVTEEQTEQLNFKVAQVSGNLKDSYYVNVVTDVVDRAAAANQTISATVEQNSNLAGTSDQDTFNMVGANSVPFNSSTVNTVVITASTTTTYSVVGYDTINNFGDGDVIKLQETVQRYSIGEVTLSDFTDGVTAGNPLFDTLNGVKYDENFPNGTGSILKIVENDTTVWLLIDTNANGIMDTRARGDGSAGGMDDKYDTLIKVVGTVNSFGETLADQITGESFITE